MHKFRTELTSSNARPEQHFDGYTLHAPPHHRGPKQRGAQGERCSAVHAVKIEQIVFTT